MATGDREGGKLEAQIPIGSDEAEAAHGAPTPWRVRWGLKRSPEGWTSLVAAPLGVYLLTRLAIYLAALYAARATASGGLSGIFSGWDGGHYLSIVTNGYPAHPDVTHYSNIAFFPGFPSMVRLVKLVTPLTTLGAGVAVSVTCGGILVIVATRLVASYYGAAAARRAGVLLAVFPGTFIVMLPYAEALAACWVVGSLWFTSRERPYLAGVFGAFASFTSPITAPIFPALLWRAWRTRDRRVAYGALLTPLGALAYMAYLWQHTGRPFTWFQEQSEAFNHYFQLTAVIKNLHYWPGIGLEELSGLAVFAAGVYALRQIRAPSEWTVYSVLLVVSVLFDSTLWLNPRVLFNAFPLVLGLGVWLRRDWYRATTLFFAAVLPVLFLLYMTLGIVTAQP